MNIKIWGFVKLRSVLDFGGLFRFWLLWEEGRGGGRWGVRRVVSLVRNVIFEVGLEGLDGW